MPSPLQPDVLVTGAGHTGLAAALALAQVGLRSVCVDPSAGEPPGESIRSVALMPDSVELLRSLGIWNRIEAHAQPITEFRFREAQAADGAVRFRASDVGLAALAWNVTNESLRLALEAAASESALVERIRPARVAALACRNDSVLAMVNDGSRFRARLAVAADGRDSPTRRFAGVRVRRWSLGRQAIAFVAATRAGESTVCTEIHGSRQTAALVPLPDGRNAVVWVLPGDDAARCMRGGATELEAAFRKFAGSGLGTFRVDSPAGSWPEAFLTAQRLVGTRLALAGESAHALSPVGAQGLNLSLRDVAALASLAGAVAAAGRDPGERALLAEYERRRRGDVLRTAGAVSAYSLLAGMPGRFPSRARTAVARTWNRVPFLRRVLLQSALPQARSAPGESR